jgi:hypothetical protein
LITSSSGITGTPVLQNPIPGYALNVNSGSLKLVRVLSYGLWAATNAPTGSVSDDHDGDGVSNGVEYVLGGSRLTGDLGKLPRVSESGDNIVITFTRHQASIDGATLLAVEIGTSLTAWPASYPVPWTAVSNNPGISVIKNSPVGFDTVTLTLPKAQDFTKFARLKVNPN